VRAVLSRFGDSAVYNRWFEPVRMALLPETALEPLAPVVAALPLTARQRRMLQLAAPALREATSQMSDVQRAGLETARRGEFLLSAATARLPIRVQAPPWQAAVMVGTTSGADR